MQTDRKSDESTHNLEADTTSNPSLILANEIIHLPDTMLVTAGDVEMKIEKSGRFVELNKREALTLVRELRKFLKV